MGRKKCFGMNDKVQAFTVCHFSFLFSNQNEEDFLQEGMVNNKALPVDPENEAYEMPPEVNLLRCLL